MRARHGADPQFALDSIFRVVEVGAPISTKRRDDAAGSLMGCSLKQFFSAAVMSIGIGARHERSCNTFDSSQELKRESKISGCPRQNSGESAQWI